MLGLLVRVLRYGGDADMKIYNIAKVDIKRLRNFIKDFDTDGLTIILTKKWKQRFIFDSGKFKEFTIKRSETGIYWSKLNSGFLYGIGGIKNINFPVIAVNCNHENWYDTFLHEFGHYIQDKTEGGLKRYMRGKERYANAFKETFK